MRPCQMTLSESYTQTTSTRLTLTVLPRGELRFELAERSHQRTVADRDTQLSVPANALGLVLGALIDSPVEPNDPDLGARVFEAITDALLRGLFPASLPGVRGWLSARAIPSAQWRWAGSQCEVVAAE